MSNKYKKLLDTIKMMYVNDNLGNLIIKHNDKWRGDYYLRDDLTFTVDRKAAGRFYLLKSGNTSILNGDRISINCGNKVLSIDRDNTIRLIDRENNYNTTTFIITNGTDNTDPIAFETSLYLISDKDEKKALKYDWGMDLVGPIDNIIIPGAVNFKPQQQPKMINGSYADICPTYINTFEFLLEKADGPITNLDTSRVSAVLPKTNELNDGYKGAFMIVLLMIVLVLCIILLRI